jgi:hypothetical protein
MFPTVPPGPIGEKLQPLLIALWVLGFEQGTSTPTASNGLSVKVSVTVSSPARPDVPAGP